MYSPFLRARQYELEALLDFAFDPRNYPDEKFLPILEPVDVKPAIGHSLFTLAARKTPFVLVANPLGKGKMTLDEVDESIIRNLLDGYEGYYLAFLISRMTTLKTIQSFVSKYKDNFRISFVHYEQPGENDQIVTYLNTLSGIHHHFFVQPFVVERYINSVKMNGAKKILILDGFNKLPKNSDYITCPNEFFSNIHLNYKQLGFDGFGDFTIMGEKFEAGAGRTRAVVIHWPYLQSSNEIWIRHFVSENTTDTEDIGGKFISAYEQLSAFRRSDNLHLNSLGNIQISGYGDEERQPQLGAIKKFSMMHHFELTVRQLR